MGSVAKSRVILLQTLVTIPYIFLLAFLMPYTTLMNIIVYSLVAMFVLIVLFKNTDIMVSEFVVSLSAMLFGYSLATPNTTVLLVSIAAFGVSLFILSKHASLDDFSWIYDKNGEIDITVLLTAACIVALPLSVPFMYLLINTMSFTSTVYHFTAIMKIAFISLIMLSVILIKKKHGGKALILSAISGIVISGSACPAMFLSYITAVLILVFMLPTTAFIIISLYDLIRKEVDPV